MQANYFLYKQQLYKLLLIDTLVTLDKDDWYNLFLSAIKEKVEGLLYKRLCEKLLLDAVPKSVKRQLYLSYTYNLKKNHLYLTEFEQLQKMLKNMNICIFPEKGIYLLNTVYKDIGVRYMEDIDILVLSSDREQVNNSIESMGYSLTLINDKTIKLYQKETPISSCLFQKSRELPDHIPFIKIDVSYISAISHSENDWHLSQTDTLLRLCKSLYNNVTENNLELLPINCVLGKLLDVIFFIRQYPDIKSNILQTKKYNALPEVAFTIECIKYYKNV
jgi:hypothetical protein